MIYERDHSESFKSTISVSDSGQMPILFVGHGSPMNAIEENEFVEGFRSIASKIPKPVAVLCISAHWETLGTFVTAMDRPATIHDFTGFPKTLYEIEYPAPGNPKLALRIRSLIGKTLVELDNNWGLDHGTWSILRHFYPDAKIPVLQLSLDRNHLPRYHYELAKELKPLREMGVLVMGSGNIVHNLGMIAWDKFEEIGYGYDWALEANEGIKKNILQDNHESLIEYRTQGKAFQLAIPTPEHFLPLLYILALKEKDEKITFFNDKQVAGSLSMTSLKIGSP